MFESETHNKPRPISSNKFAEIAGLSDKEIAESAVNSGVLRSIGGPKPAVDVINSAPEVSSGGAGSDVESLVSLENGHRELIKSIEDHGKAISQVRGLFRDDYTLAA